MWVVLWSIMCREDVLVQLSDALLVSSSSARELEIAFGMKMTYRCLQRSGKVFQIRPHIL